jgi:hypothetical protein
MVPVVAWVFVPAIWAKGWVVTSPWPSSPCSPRHPGVDRSSHPSGFRPTTTGPSVLLIVTDDRRWRSSR